MEKEENVPYGPSVPEMIGPFRLTTLLVNVLNSPSCIVSAKEERVEYQVTSNVSHLPRVSINLSVRLPPGW